MRNLTLRCLQSCLLSWSLVVVGCGNNGTVGVRTGSDGGSGGTLGGGGVSGGGSGGDSGADSGGDSGVKLPVGSAACSDGKDNDGDGKVDFDDPECVGPLDNDEGSFATGIPGDNVDPCKQDCFFDGNSGMGDDGCEWQLKCDPLNSGANAEHKCEYDAQYAQQHAKECSVSNSQSDKCIKNCRPLTPNGCDCFGCCQVPGAATAIRLSASCTAKDFGDPSKCQPCTQVEQCNNPCEHCELCMGKDTLPADCAPASDGGTPGSDGSVPTPVPSCGTYAACARTPQGSIDPVAACPANYGCVQGCCLPTIIIE
jgi:hypothetical protein